MASYTTHYLQAKHMISYRYICEYCGNDSQSQIREIEALVEKRTGIGKKLTPSEQSEANHELRTRLVAEVRKEKDLVEKGDYSFFNGRCPHCGKPQSWAGGTLENAVKRKAASATMWVGLIGFIVYIVLMAVCGFWAATACYVGACAGVYAITYLIAYTKWKSVRKAVESSPRKTLPWIDWNGM